MKKWIGLCFLMLFMACSNSTIDSPNFANENQKGVLQDPLTNPLSEVEVTLWYQDQESGEWSQKGTSTTNLAGEFFFEIKSSVVEMGYHLEATTEEFYLFEETIVIGALSEGFGNVKMGKAVSLTVELDEIVSGGKFQVEFEDRPWKFSLSDSGEKIGPLPEGYATTAFLRDLEMDKVIAQASVFVKKEGKIVFSPE